MRGLLSVVVVFAVLVVASNGAKNPFFGQKTLVLLDTFDQKQAYSNFFNSLKVRGYELTFALADNAELTIEQYGVFLYDQLIIFSPEVQEFGGVVEGETIIKFIDSGRSVLIAGGSGLGEPVREVAAECGVTFFGSNTAVIDHMNFDTADFGGEHTLIVVSPSTDASVLVGSKKVDPLLYRGIGMSIDKDTDGLLFTVATAAGTAYSHSTSEVVKATPEHTGSDIVLIAALQARNNARVLFSGSLELFSNEFFNSAVQTYTVDGSAKKYAKSGNAAFVGEVTAWLFQERGVLRSVDVAHSLKDGSASASGSYRIKDEVTYGVTIQEWNGASWGPYSANDVQLEFVMLDPYVRTGLTGDKNGRFTVSFMLPDVYGIFKFNLNYRRFGYSRLEESTQVTVVPFRHNDYERFIPAAYPYYTSAFSMMAGFFVLSVVFLHLRD